jgi:C1A family cysteine protease
MINKLKILLNKLVEYFKSKLNKTHEEFERKFGWLPDDPDDRDLLFSTAPIPQKQYTPVDLRPNCPPVADQKNLGSCSAFGAIGLVQYVRKVQKFKDLWQPSALFTYYTTRELHNTVQHDSGASVRNALKSVIKNGVIQESSWPYIVEKFAEKPPRNVYMRALNYQALSYRRLTDCSLTEMLECLDQGYPFIFGLKIYGSFVYCKKDGIIPMPKPSSEMWFGGHCIMCVGWKIINSKRHFIIQNSWSDKWGDKGYCYIPEDYITAKTYASDFWMIRIMEN